MARRPLSMNRPVRCPKCAAAFKLAEPTDVEGSFVELLRVRWLHMAKKGAGRENWEWLCRACRPVGSTSFRLSTQVSRRGLGEHPRSAGEPHRKASDLARAF